MYLKDDPQVAAWWSGNSKKMTKLKAHYELVKNHDGDKKPWWNTDEFDHNGNLTEDAAVKRIIAAASSSEPTDKPIYRGLTMTPENLRQYKVGNTIDMSLSSFTDYSDRAVMFAHTPGPNSKGSKKVVLELEPGAKVAPFSKALGSNSKTAFTDADEAESIAFGSFSIVSRVIDKNAGVYRITIRQENV